jgi:hypothetical protein
LAGFARFFDLPERYCAVRAKKSYHGAASKTFREGSLPRAGTDDVQSIERCARTSRFGAAAPAGRDRAGNLTAIAASVLFAAALAARLVCGDTRFTAQDARIKRRRLDPQIQTH